MSSSARSPSSTRSLRVVRWPSTATSHTTVATRRQERSCSRPSARHVIRSRRAVRHAARAGLGEVGWLRSGRRASVGPGARALGLTAHRWRRCVRRPEYARAKPARDHGTAGREGAPRQRHTPKCAMHPTPSHRPCGCAIAARRAEVHQGHEGEWDHLGQRDHVQLAHNSQDFHQGYRAMSRRWQRRWPYAGLAQWPPRCLPSGCPGTERTRAEPPASVWHPGTNMAFVGFKKPTDSADVIAFLNKNQ